MPAPNQAAQSAQNANPAGIYDNGTYHSVYNDSARGGTGFWDQYGHWILISSILNSGQRNVTYVYPPGSAQQYPSSEYAPYGVPQRHETKNGIGFFGFLFLLIVLAAIGVGIFFLIKAMTPKPEVNPADEKQTLAASTKPPTNSQQTDSSLPEYWESIKPGSTALLSDEESLNDNIKNGKGPTPQEYVIKSIQTLTEIRDIGKWIAFQLVGAQGPLLLIAKIVDGDMVLRVYYPAPEFPAGSRTSLLNKGVKWLFQPPENETRFELEDLAITTEFTRDADGESVVFVKSDDTYEAELAENPLPSGQEPVKQAFLTEFAATTKTPNPESLVLEICSPTDRSKSFLNLYIGTTIRPKEVQILRA